MFVKILAFLREPYWAVYRFFRWHKIFHPIQMCREIKYFCQRGRRGWADCDTWSLNQYLCQPSMMPAALRYLKTHKHGIPISMLEDDGNVGNPTDTAMKRAEARWDAVVDQMIAAFDAGRRIQDGLYEEELGPFQTDHMDAIHLLQKRDQKIFEDGMKLFVENFMDLWD